MLTFYHITVSVKIKSNWLNFTLLLLRLFILVVINVCDKYVTSEISVVFWLTFSSSFVRLTLNNVLKDAYFVPAQAVLPNALFLALLSCQLFTYVFILRKILGTLL